MSNFLGKVFLKNVRIAEIALIRHKPRSQQHVWIWVGLQLDCQGTYQVQKTFDWPQHVPWHAFYL